MRGLAILFFILTDCGLVFSQPQEADGEHKNHLKAAFLYHFSTYIDWPNGRLVPGPLDFCVMETEPAVFHFLKQGLLGKRVHDRHTDLRVVQDASQLEGCDVIFMDEFYGANFWELKKSIDAHKVVTVDGSLEFLKQGGLIRFYLEDNRLRFEVNLKEARILGFRISPELLRHARIFE